MFEEEVNTRSRTIETNGAKIFLNCKDPFGFWFVSFERGELPDVLSGAFSSAELATSAVTTYLEKHRSREKKAA